MTKSSSLTLHVKNSQRIFVVDAQIDRFNSTGNRIQGEKKISFHERSFSFLSRIIREITWKVTFCPFRFNSFGRSALGYLLNQGRKKKTRARDACVTNAVNRRS